MAFVRNTFWELGVEIGTGLRPRALTDPVHLQFDGGANPTCSDSCCSDTSTAADSNDENSEKASVSWADVDSDSESTEKSSADTSSADGGSDTTFVQTPPRRLTEAAKRRRRRALAAARANVEAPSFRASTTLKFCNLAKTCTRQKLLDLLDATSLVFDFVYLPIDFHTGLCCGHAFVNFKDELHADAALVQLHGRCLSQAEGKLEVAESRDNQGLTSLVERYRNSPVMHPNMPEEWRPLLLADCKPVTFPAPTSKLKAVRRRDGQPLI